MLRARNVPNETKLHVGPESETVPRYRIGTSSSQGRISHRMERGPCGWGRR